MPNRFHSAVPFYTRYRLGYPDRLIGRVIALAGLRPGDPVLDLGCGPGLLALPFARAGMAVTAADPEPAMLAALKTAAEAENLPVTRVMAGAPELPAGLGPFRLVVMGRAFHWMDRAATLARLDAMGVETIALFDDDHLKTAENRWRDVLDAVASRYGADQAPHRRARADPNHRSHESVLLDSPFAVLETVGEVVVRARTADDIVGYAKSLSVAAPDVLKERLAAFEVDLRKGLAALAPDGQFREIAEMRALIARRTA